MFLERPNSSLSVFPVRTLGEFIRARAFKVGFKKIDAFVSAAKKSKATIYRVLDLEDAEKSHPIHAATLEAVAESLEFTEWNDLLRAWKEDDVMRGLKTPQSAEPRISSTPSPLIHIREGPRYTAPVHRDLYATRFREAPQEDGERRTLTLNVPFDFAAEITGACMLPDYPPGFTVAFSFQPINDGRLEVGAAYYVLNDKGEVTFKRLKSVDKVKRVMVLECTNPEMAGSEIRISFGTIERIARAVWVGRIV